MNNAQFAAVHRGENVCASERGDSQSAMPDLEIMPDTFDTLSQNRRPTVFRGKQAVLETPTPPVPTLPPLLPPTQRYGKRLLDVGVSTAVIAGTSIIWLPLLACVWLDTKASPIYLQERVGKNGQPFTLYKFRSMRADAEAAGPQLATKNDQRVTRMGKFLRKYRIDEFPQFINVFKGDMSLVGPRPERSHFVQEITKRDPDYARLHQIRPGITSWGQVKFGYAENVDEMLIRMRYDLLYLQKISLKTDFKILRATIRVVLSGCGQ